MGYRIVTTHRVALCAAVLAASLPQSLPSQDAGRSIRITRLAADPPSIARAGPPICAAVRVDIAKDGTGSPFVEVDLGVFTYFGRDVKVRIRPSRSPSSGTISGAEMGFPFEVCSEGGTAPGVAVLKGEIVRRSRGWSVMEPVERAPVGAEDERYSMTDQLWLPIVP